ncbi:AhpC/TSA family protein [Reichenbachiella agarivorans]|uniref:thioredoxin-dependent peroxiredoxin n=1 Tax=Reichenbachiella agarivorans TaxID=2979464 RepID=A0ABY6CL05_9BACT|nr:peroxiredoxin-like family protein [Reichenbachiella agarivorans]UXP31201.1 AhpC/TSA family protein [Reichenbachiella agarivorans]
MMKTKYLLLSAVILIVAGCGDSKQNKTSMDSENKTLVDTEKEITQRPLETVLNERKMNFLENASEEKKQQSAAGIESIRQNKIQENALQVGDTAINFSLPNATDKTITLYDELENGPVILMWYRGGWCPYCNLTLRHMQESLPDFKKYGANLLAVSPQLPDSSISTKEKNELEFEVLSDLDNRVAHQYKVAYKLTDDLIKKYQNGFGLSNYNGNDKGELPIAATYIIGQDRVIKYAFLDPDYRNRAEPVDLIEVLKTLK